jgi:hypothetical protein
LKLLDSLLQEVCISNWWSLMHCIAFNALYSMPCIQCLVFNALYSMHCIICIVFYALYSMHCILCIVFYVLYYMQCMLCIVSLPFPVCNNRCMESLGAGPYFSLYNCILCIVFYALYSMYCIICSVCYALYHFLFQFVTTGAWNH